MTPDQKELALLPCTCGKQPYIRHYANKYYIVSCKDEACKNTRSVYHAFKSEAVRTWNERATPPVTLAQAKAQPTFGQWISVEDRLPEIPGAYGQSVDVLTLLNEGAFRVCRFIRTRHGEYWDYVYKPTHWMPLPNPPGAPSPVATTGQEDKLIEMCAYLNEELATVHSVVEVRDEEIAALRAQVKRMKEAGDELWRKKGVVEGSPHWERIMANWLAASEEGEKN